MILSNPEPVSGHLMDLVQRSANAWEGDYRTKDRTEWDPAIWNEGPGRDPWKDGQVRTIVRGDDFEVGIVDVTVSDRLFLAKSDTLIENDYDNAEAAKKQIYAFVMWPTENFEFMQLLGQPVTEGYLVMLTVLADRDMLVPVKAEWVGRGLTEEQAASRLRLMIDSVGSISVRAKVPAPSLPVELSEEIERARSGIPTSREREEFVELLVSLDPVVFLEAIDRMIPWMKGPIESAKLAWMDKNKELADHAWKIMNANPRFAEKVRLAPWKSSIGSPTSRELRMRYTGENERKDWIEMKRKPDGRY